MKWHLYLKSVGKGSKLSAGTRFGRDVIVNFRKLELTGKILQDGGSTVRRQTETLGQFVGGGPVLILSLEPYHDGEETVTMRACLCENW